MTEQLTSNLASQQPIPQELDFTMLEQVQPVVPSLNVAPAAPHASDGEEVDWGYTKNAEEVRQIREQLEFEAGKERPRHSIGRDTVLSEGVYEGSYGGEAIVLDYENDPELIDDTITAVIHLSTNTQTGKVDKGLILDAVFNTVSERMKYNSSEVDRIFAQDLGGRNGSKISLSAYIEKGVGECRHQALYAGLVLEKLRERNVVSGHASVDRNMVKSGPDGRYDGHAWVRYTNSGGEVYILDIAQKKIGTLEEMTAARQRDPAHNWDYRRPEDMQPVQAVDGAYTAGRDELQAPPYDASSYTNEAGVIDKLPWE